MDTMYYYVHEKKALGPVSLEQIAALVKSGVIHAGSPVCPVGGNQWVKASTVAEINSLFEPKTATVPTTPPVKPRVLPPTPPVEPIQPAEEEYYYDEDSEHSNSKNLIIIGAVVVVLAVVALGIVYLIFNKKGGKRRIVETTVTQSQPGEQASAEENSNGMPINPFDSYATQLAKMASTGSFFGIREGDTADKVKAMYGGSAEGIQRKAYHKGWNLQFFFDGSASRSSSVITGIAASRAASAFDACNEFDQLMGLTCESNGYTTFITHNGCYVSSGRSRGKFYVYFYFPNAPKKDPAPR